jgi:hypothetical protein
MKEDLSLYGKELNYANAIWSAAYVFGQIPSNLLLTRVGDRHSPHVDNTLTRIQVNVPLYIAFLELAWTVFTFATAGVKDVKQLYVFRFLCVSCVPQCPTISYFILALACLKLATSRRSCMCAQAITNLTSWLDAIH